MKQVIVNAFGGPEQLQVIDAPTPEPGPGQVRVRLTSIGMNHAELMARRGDYKLASGDPPFTPGLEGGGVIESVGPGLSGVPIGDRVILGADIPRIGGGTYRSHVICDAGKIVPAPRQIPDVQLGAIWLPYLTAWGCLVWKQNLRSGQTVGIPAASSSVGIAAAQVVRRCGAIAIGLTSNPDKVAVLRSMPEATFDHLIVTRDRPWHQDIKQITAGKGIDVYFDPVAAGAFLDTEVRTLAQDGAIHVYGMLGSPGTVDVSPLIRKRGMIRGWIMGEVWHAGDEHLRRAYREILAGFEDGAYRLAIARTFRLEDVRAAHEYMEKGEHIGKLVLVP